MQQQQRRQGPPVFVLNQNTQREQGKEAQKNNIAAAKMGNVIMTNDGHAILREFDVPHPAARSMIELSRTQDENVGDGTTSVIILAGEMLSLAEPWLDRNVHPTQIIAGYQAALSDAETLLKSLAFNIDPNNREQLTNIVQSTLATKFVSRWMKLMCDIAIDATLIVRTIQNGHTDIDLKKYAKVEKVPGGEIEECRVLRGVMFEKDILHPSMKRRIENPRIILLDCNLEYKKPESGMTMEAKDEKAFETMLNLENATVERMVANIAKFKPDLVITEKGISDIAQHYMLKHNITALRRLRKTDNNRIARAVGATIVHRPEEIKESDVGTGCGLFEVRKLGDEYFTFLENCKDPKACTILLRGASKDVLNEVERNLQDALNVARNVVLEPLLVPGGGAVEMALSRALSEKAKTISGVKQWPYESVALALEVIPRTLMENCGGNVIRLLTQLRAKHAEDPEKNKTWGVDGNAGVLADMKATGIWEPFVVKMQTIKTAIESACLILRVDDVIIGLKSNEGPSSGPGPQANPEDMEP